MQTLQYLTTRHLFIYLPIYLLFIYFRQVLTMHPWLASNSQNSVSHMLRLKTWVPPCLLKHVCIQIVFKNLSQVKAVLQY